MKNFPKTLYVKRDLDGDTTYFIPQDNLTDAAEIGASTKVGVYKLVGTQNVSLVTRSTPMKKV